MAPDKEHLYPIANTVLSNREADIVFVHGLMGSSHATWQHSKPGKPDYFFWPEELGKELSNCGIWTVGYAAGLTHFGNPGMIIEQRAKNIARTLTLHGIGKKPVLFICHSMGGLIIKSLVVNEVFTSDGDYKDLVQNIVGIVFCGTPHRGAELASIAAALGLAQPHVVEMSKNSVQLDLSHDKFLEWHKESQLPIESYLESMPLRRKTLFKSLLGRFIRTPIVVQRTSANPGMGRWYDVDADHLTLVKPTPAKPEIHTHVFCGSLKFIRSVLERLRQKEETAPTLSKSVQDPSASASGIGRELGMLVFDLASDKEDCLKGIRSKISGGYYREAEEELRAMMQKSASWEVLPRDTKAKVYEALTEVVLRRRRDFKEVEGVLAEAKKACPGYRFLCTEALVATEKGEASEFLENYPNPLSAKEWRWKLLLMINSGRSRDVIVQLVQPSPPFPIDSGLQGILTWAYLVTKDLPKAANSNAMALEESPDSWGNLEAKGFISYFQAVVPLSDSWLEIERPLPLPIECIKTSEMDCLSLKVAATTFQELADRADYGSEHQRRSLIWCLASWVALARVPHPGSAEAERLGGACLKRILEVFPDSLGVIPLALQAGLDFDYQPWEEVLRRQIEEGGLDPVEALSHILLYSHKEAEAAQLLDQFKGRYEDLEARKVWRYYRIQLAAVSGDSELILSILEQSENCDEKTNLQVMASVHTARRTNDAEECLIIHRERWMKTSNPLDLYQACKLHLMARKPKFVVDNADALLVAVPTGESLRLCVCAFASERLWQRCISTMDTWHHLMPTINQDTQMVRIKIEAFWKQGLFPEALQLALELAEKTHLNEDRMRLFDLAHDAGKREYLFSIAKELSVDADATTPEKVYVAGKISALSPELARTLLSSVTMDNGDMDAQTAAHAFMTASQIGLEDKIGHKVLPLALVPGGPMKHFGLDQALEIMSKRRDRIAHIFEQYQKGSIPLHVYASHVGQPLSAFLFDAAPPLEEGFYCPPNRLFSARIRHGRRPEFHSMPSSGWKLFLDVTSLVLAKRLGVLEFIEASDAELYISPHVPRFLLDELAMLRDVQVSRIAKQRDIINMIDKQSIKSLQVEQNSNLNMDWAEGMSHEWQYAVSAAIAQNSVFVDFWPVGLESAHGQLLQIPDVLGGHICGPRALVTAMLNAGWVSGDEVMKKMDRHNAFLVEGPPPILIDGTFIILDGGIAECLHEVDVLADLASRCSVVIVAEDEIRMRASLRQSQYREEIVREIDSLQSHISEMIGRRYQVCASIGTSGEADDSSAFKCLCDFISFGKSHNGYVVVDDRFIGGFLSVEQSQFVNLLDVLSWLQESAKMEKSELYKCANRLRVGNSRYIPISAAELSWHLRKATNLHTKTLSETPQLVIIRQYYAACFLDARFLQLSSIEDPARSEILFLLSVGNTCAEVLAELWATENDEAVRNAKCEWMLRAMAVDVVGLVSQLINPQAKVETKGQWLDYLFSLYVAKLMQKAKPGQIAACCGSFAKWLIEVMDLPLESYRTIFGAIVGLLPSAKKPEKLGKARRHIENLVAAALSELLQDGGKYLKVSEDQERQLRIHHTETFGDVVFPKRDVWRAIELAMTKGAAECEIDQNKDPVSLRRLNSSAHRPAIRFDFNDERSFNLKDPLLLLASPNLSERRDFLESKRKELDLSNELSGPIFDAIQNAPSAEDRLGLYLERRGQSVSARMNDLHRILQEGTRLTVGKLVQLAGPFECKALIQHLFPGGFDATGSIREQLDNGEKWLCDDLGIYEALCRYASLPVALPQQLRDRFLSLPKDELIKLVSRFDHDELSPLHRLHLACMLLDSDSIYQERGLELLRGAASQESDASWSFHNALIQWSLFELIGSDGVKSGLMSMIASSWVHAGVFHMKIGMPPKSAPLGKDLVQQARSNRLLFDSNIGNCSDVADPRAAKGRKILTHALPRLLKLDALQPAIREAVRDLWNAISFEHGSAVDLYHARGDWTNVTGSFLSPLSKEDVQGWLSQDTSFVDHDQVVQQVIEVFNSKEDSKAFDCWSIAAAVSDFLDAPLGLRSILAPAIDSMEFKRLEGNDFQRLSWTTRYIFKQRSWHRTAESEFWNRMLIDLWVAMKERRGGDVLPAFLECVLAMSCLSKSPKENARSFSHAALAVMRSDISFATIARNDITKIVQCQDAEVQFEMMPMLCELRVLAGKDPKTQGTTTSLLLSASPENEVPKQS